MKSWIKGLLIASAVCIGVGGAMCVSAWAMGGRFSWFRHKRFGVVGEATQSTEVPIEQVEAVAERGTALEVSENVIEQIAEKTAMFDGAEIGKLEILLTGGKAEIITDDEADSIRVICGNEQYRCYQSVDHDTLEIEIERRKKADKHLLEYLDQWDESAVQIIIPAGSHFREAELEVWGGVMTVDWLSADSIELELAGGVLNVVEGIAGKVSSECMAGALTYEGQVLWEAEAECEAGSIRYFLEGAEEDFNYELEASVGSILIGGTEKGKLRDDVFIKNTGAGKRAKLECMAGKIEMDFYQSSPY